MLGNLRSHHSLCNGFLNLKLILSSLFTKRKMLTVIVNKQKTVQDVKRDGQSVPYSVQIMNPAAAPFLVLTDSRGRFRDLISHESGTSAAYTIETRSKSPQQSDLSDLSELEEPRTSVLPGSVTKEYKCCWCGKKGATREEFCQCKRCKTSLYCTRLCHSGHWHEGCHATECKPFSRKE